jgi:hypothetical protein
VLILSLSYHQLLKLLVCLIFQYKLNFYISYIPTSLTLILGGFVDKSLLLGFVVALNNPELTLISNIVLKIVAPIYVLYYHRKNVHHQIVGEEFAAIFNDFVKSKL